MGFILVPVAVVEDVLTVQVDDVEVDAADVIVLLIVAHDVRGMSAAITIQKKPALNNMMAVSFKGDVEYYSERYDIDWGYICRRWFVRVRVPWYQPYSVGSPVLKVGITRDRDRGANALLHTTSLFRIGHHLCVWHMLLERNEPKLQLLPLKPCSANNFDPITRVLWSCLAFRLLTSNLEMTRKVSEQSQMS